MSALLILLGLYFLAWLLNLDPEEKRRLKNKRRSKCETRYELARNSKL